MAAQNPADEGIEPVIRAKWLMDGATTLAEAATKLREYANELDQLARDGWTLEQPIEDDYGFLVAPVASHA